ncbi:hypothetical protein DFH06DRAFT_1360378 [Mycena polygramma]|nr:hypothetical protein DFH06DRAFT_1360378 [Mycena polygramma]
MSATLAAQRDALYKTLIADVHRLPLQPLPRLHVYVQGADGSRLRVDQDPMYYPFVQKAAGVFTHLIGSTVAQTKILAILQTITYLDRPAKQALKATLGEARDLERTDIRSYFLDKTPSVVIAALEETPSKLVWGEPPPELSQSQIEEQRLYHELMISIILLRESMNALTKEYLTSDLVTPLWPGLESDGQGGGAVGRTFEQNYVHFQLQVVWATESFKKQQRMWYIHCVLATKVGWPPLIIGIHNVQRLLETLHCSLLWDLRLEVNRVRFTVKNDGYIRRSIGIASPDEEDENENLDMDEDDAFVYGITCSRERVG